MREITYKGEIIKIISPREVPHKYEPNQKTNPSGRFYPHCLNCGGKPADLVHFWGQTVSAPAKSSEHELK